MAYRSYILGSGVLEEYVKRSCEQYADKYPPFTEYARMVMDKRGVGEGVVYAVLEDPDAVYMDLSTKLFVAVKKLERNVIVVLYDVKEVENCVFRTVVDVFVVHGASVDRIRRSVAPWMWVKVG